MTNMKYTYTASDEEKNTANENLSHALLAKVKQPLLSMLDKLDKIERDLLLLKAASSDFPYQGMAHEFHSTRETLAKLLIIVSESDVELCQLVNARLELMGLNADPINPDNLEVGA